MRFLADESCDFIVVRRLRSAGYEVLAVAEASPSSADDSVLEFGLRRGRMLITEDKDFGRWVYADRRATGGVLFLRYPAGARSGMAQDVLDLVTEKGDELIGRFVVLQPGRVRIGRRPIR